MGMGIYPHLEKDIANIDPLNVCGKALCHAVYDPKYQQINDPVIQIEQFIGYTTEDIAAYIEVAEEELPQCEPTWFDAQEGIKIFEQILNASTIDESAREDVRQILDILKRAYTEHIRFYLTTDMP